MISLLSDDTDVFVLLLYRANRADTQCKVLMEHWDGSVLDTKVTCPDFVQKCLQLPCMPTLSLCDTTSYPCDKGNATALHIMISENYLGVTALGDVGTTHKELMNAVMPFFVALYGQPLGTSMESAR